MRYLIRFSYLGTKYKGIQKQPEFSRSTIQGVLENALLTLKPANEITTVTCSRTDKGVHAIKNFLHVDLEHRLSGETFAPNEITQRLNVVLQEEEHDIIVADTTVVPDHFSVRHHASWRSYIYRLALVKPHLVPFMYGTGSYEKYLPIVDKGRCHIIHGSLDMDKVEVALGLLKGKHDFSSFTKRLAKEQRDPVRTVHEFRFYPTSHHSYDRNIDYWEFYIRANSYLYLMVRKLVGTVMAYGYGHLSLDHLKLMLCEPSPSLWIKAALPPSCGLYLHDIAFHNSLWDTPKMSFDSTNSV